MSWCLSDVEVLGEGKQWRILLIIRGARSRRAWRQAVWEAVCVSHSVVSVSDSATPWGIARQVWSIWFSRQGYWSGLPFPSPGDLPDPGNKPGSPTLQANSLPSDYQGSLVEEAGEWQWRSPWQSFSLSPLSPLLEKALTLPVVPPAPVLSLPCLTQF